MSLDDLQHINKYGEPNCNPDRIMVIGVGGGGSNAVNHMFAKHTQNVSFVVANTDRQALAKSPVPKKLMLGPTVTKGRGAGNVPETARRAAEESAQEIDALFTDETDMVFITASMGGGTGTGAGPVVARIARERGLLTVGIVTIPFLFEGMKKINKALAGAEEMARYVDALLVINNERLTECYPDMAFVNAFAKADDTLAIAAESISEIVTNDGYINLDFNDVDTTLRNGGTALISVGYGEGENRVTDAINDALHSPLLKNTDVFSSKRLLFNLCYSPNSEQEFKSHEANELSAFVSRIDSQVDVDVIWGITYDDKLGDRVKFTILAAGFDAAERDFGVDRPQVNTGTSRQETEKINNEKIGEYYGAEKIGEMQRIKDQQRYYIYSNDQLDNDELIDSLERTPAYNRDKKMMVSSVRPSIQSTPTPAPAGTQRPAAETRQQAPSPQPAQPRQQQSAPAKPGPRPNSNVISFGSDE